MQTQKENVRWHFDWKSQNWLFYDSLNVCLPFGSRNSTLVNLMVGSNTINVPGIFPLFTVLLQYTIENNLT